MKAGEILKNVWVELGFKSKHAFAKSLGRRVELIDRSIKDERISNILEMLIVTKHPVNPDYLKTGIGKIRIDKPICKDCIEKDERIRHLYREVENLSDYISDLKRQLIDSKKTIEELRLKRTG